MLLVTGKSSKALWKVPLVVGGSKRSAGKMGGRDLGRSEGRRLVWGTVRSLGWLLTCYLTKSAENQGEILEVRET